MKTIKTQAQEPAGAALALPFTDNGQDVDEKVWFPNGHGVSIVRDQCTYGGRAGLFEVAVIQPSDDAHCSWDFDYTIPVTNNVVGWQDIAGVLNLMKQVHDLPPTALALPGMVARPAQVKP